MKKLIIAISSFLVIATSAMSMGLPKVGISGNYAAYSATGTEENYSNAGVLDQTSIKEVLLRLNTHQYSLKWILMM